jgi:SAM-dependent methyltransferase
MNKKDIDIYNERYNERLQIHGIKPETLGWGGGIERQNIRFKALSEIGIKNGDSILDVGCGFADMYVYLKQIGWKGNYEGIDINSNLIEIATNLHPDVKFQNKDFLSSKITSKYDWVLSSGIFNAQLLHEDNMEYIKNMLKKMYQTSLKGVSSDFMSTYVDFQHPDAYHTNPSELLEFLKSEINTSQVIRMDYLQYEFCVYLKK